MIDLLKKKKKKTGKSWKVKNPDNPDKCERHNWLVNMLLDYNDPFKLERSFYSRSLFSPLYLFLHPIHLE